MKNLVSLSAKAMQTAWSYIKDGFFTDIATALRAAWCAVKIKAQKTVFFTYQKADGSERKAIATVPPADYEPKGNGVPAPSHIVRYYDAGANSWRSFDVTRFLSIQK